MSLLPGFLDHILPNHDSDMLVFISTTRQVPHGIQAPAFMEVVPGVGAQITISSNPSATKCHLSLYICWEKTKKCL